MLRNRIYYRLKPLLPWRVRMLLRRYQAKRLRQQNTHVWPINPASALPPTNWPGWPGGKQFALVLTHDVEGTKGLGRCRQLAEWEAGLGLRSSFNFIPEGKYRVPDALRHWLTAQGFEVGVHDLKHDGKLYQSRETFEGYARRINQYLKAWNAVGFRSGSMHHNLDWLHRLDVCYDASTFDTDPFEPQPDGVNTIFPFWVERGDGGRRTGVGGAGAEVQSSRLEDRRSEFDAPGAALPSSTLHPPSSIPAALAPGYVELPYTLPQDSTLFFVLREQTIDIWRQKLEWIAEHGGMALINIHPDYLNFPESTPKDWEFPMARYRAFLDHVQARYAGAYWHCLPREAAAFCAACRPCRQIVPRQKRVCMLTHSFYESDSRVMRYAESLAARGDQVDVIGLRHSKSLGKHETVKGVQVVRIQQRAGRDKGKWAYLLSVVKFLVRSSCLLSWRQLRRRYDVVHVHNVPDFLVFAAWLPRLTGAKVILDIHDLLPEFYANKYTGRTAGIGYKVMCGIERSSAWFADHVIISNDLWHAKVTARSLPAEKCSVFLNYLDGTLFYPRTRSLKNGKFIILFPGGLYRHQGLDLAINAFAAIRHRVPGAEFHIYGDGDARHELMDLARQLGLNGSVQFHAPVPVQQVPDLIANADLGVVPKRADLFGNEAYSTKIVEFMSQGVPVVVARTKIDSFYFNDRLVRFFEPGNVSDLADKMRELAEDKGLRESLVQNGLQYAGYRNWDNKKQDYFALLDSLAG